MKTIRLLALVCTTLFAITNAAEAQDCCRLDVDALSNGKEIVLVRPADGLYPIQVMHTLKATVAVQSFGLAGDQGRVEVKFRTGCDAAQTLQRAELTFTSPVMPLCLEIPPLAGTGAYKGFMILESDGKTATKTFSVSNAPPPQGTLVVSQRPPPIPVTLPLWGAPEVTWFSVVLQEKSDKIALQGITANLKVTKSPVPFDLKQNVQFRINGSPLDDLDAWPPVREKLEDASKPQATLAERDLRTIPVGGRRRVDVGLQPLRPGEYTGTLGFTGTNSAASADDQTLALTINVRDHPLWAVVCLIVAVIISFIATKVLAAQRRRINLLKQIRDSTPLWLSALDPTAPVVWVQCVLHQARGLSSRFWLTSPDVIEADVAGARSMLKILEQVHQLRGRLIRALDQMLERRVLIGLGAVVSDLDAGPPDQAAVTRMQADLSAFEDWLTKDKVLAVFQRTVEPSIRSLVADVDLDRVPDVAKEDVAKLVNRLKDGVVTPPQTIHEMEMLYRTYAAVSCLWTLREDVAALSESIADPDLMRLLKRIDDRDWEHLKASALTIRVPKTTSVEGLEAYVPLQFSVEAADSRVGGTYLFKHKVRYAWTFVLTPTPTLREKLGLKRAPEPITLEPVSLGPSLVQYFPRAGSLQVSVIARYEGAQKEDIPPAGIDVKDSSQFRFLQAFQGVEIVSWLIAAVIAIVTGLSTYYFKTPAFGSYQDYLTLFLWGVGVDQGKTFLQALQATSPPASGAPAP